MKEKKIEFEERVNCGIAYCEDEVEKEIKQDFAKHEEKHKQLKKWRKAKNARYKGEQQWIEL